MRTLFLNPPSFEGFDGGASSRWPASREIESYWYPVWLCYPAGMLPDSKVVDAPPHKISIEQTVAMARDFELLVLFTSTPGFHVDVKIARDDEGREPETEGGVCRAAGHRRAGKSSRGTPLSTSWSGASSTIRLPPYAKGKPLEELPGVSFRKDGQIVHNPEGRLHRESR